MALNWIRNHPTLTKVVGGAVGLGAAFTIGRCTAGGNTTQPKPRVEFVGPEFSCVDEPVTYNGKTNVYRTIKDPATGKSYVLTRNQFGEIGLGERTGYSLQPKRRRMVVEERAIGPRQCLAAAKAGRK